MTEQQYTNILVPVDGSQAAEHALYKAIEIAKRNNAHLDVLNVIDLKQFSVSFGGVIDVNGDVIYQSFEEVNEYLLELIEKVKNQGFEDIEAHIRYGTPKTVIARDFLHDHHNDLIVLGATGLNPLERVFVGSVTDFVIRVAACDVMVAR